MTRTSSEKKYLSLKTISRPVRIMIFGTFDLVHKGHLNFFKQARGLAKEPYLIVSVARDANVKKIKGTKPYFSEKARLASIKKIRGVNKAVLGGINNYINHIVKEKPNLIALGHDQQTYVKNLGRILRAKGLMVKILRLKPYKRFLYRSSFLKRLKCCNGFG